MPEEFDGNEFPSPAPSKLPGQLSFGWELDDDDDIPTPTAPKSSVAPGSGRSNVDDSEVSTQLAKKKRHKHTKQAVPALESNAPVAESPDASTEVVILKTSFGEIVIEDDPSLDLPAVGATNGRKGKKKKVAALEGMKSAGKKAKKKRKVEFRAGKSAVSVESDEAVKTEKAEPSNEQSPDTDATETEAADQLISTEVPLDEQPVFAAESLVTVSSVGDSDPAEVAASAAEPAEVSAEVLSQTEQGAVTSDTDDSITVKKSHGATKSKARRKRPSGISPAVEETEPRLITEQHTVKSNKPIKRSPSANPDRNYAETMEYIPLKWGARLPQVGFGFWKVDKDKTADVCYQAIKVGYRHLDCACDYGNEVEVGQGIAAAINDGLCEREDLWVTSKLWNTYHAAEHVRPAFERSLNDLGLDYLDLYLIHFPLAQKFVPFETRYPPGWFTDPDAANPIVEEAKISIRETWHAMEELAKEGMIKQIGVCNFTTGLLRDLLSYCHIRPTVTQVETHPQLTQQRLLRYCQQERIAYTAFSPLGAQSYFSLGMADPAESVLGNSIVADIAETVGKTPAQVVLRWGVQRGTSVIPKTSSVARMRENINIFDFELTLEQMAAIDSLDQHRRFNDPGHFGEAAFNTFLPIYD